MIYFVLLLYTSYKGDLGQKLELPLAVKKSSFLTLAAV